MATTKFKGTDVELLGNEVNVGDKAPAITVVNSDGLGDIVVGGTVDGIDIGTDVAANTTDSHPIGSDTTLGTMTADIDMNDAQQVVSLQAPAALGEAIRQTTNVTETNLVALTGGGDTSLHGHSDLHTQD